ncbi:DUF2806 domain-containing protein [Hymenobacter tenuis]
MADEEKAEGSKSFSLVNMKDAAGLSTPLTKFFDVVGGWGTGLGSSVKDFLDVYLLDKKRAQNEAYRVTTVGTAQTHTNIERARAYMELLNGGQAQLQTMSLDGQNTNATLVGVPIEVKQLQEKINDRVTYQNILHQLNLDAVKDFAEQELKNEESVSSEPVDIDWTQRLYSIAEDATTEEMQALFGKILAGEIKRPGSFSLRTLEALRNLNKSEAASFKRVADYVIDGNKKGVLVTRVNNRGENILEAHGVTYSEIMSLVEAGLLMSHESTNTPPTGSGIFVLTLGSTGVIYENTPELNYNYDGYLLTLAGFQLYQLIKNELSPPLSVIEAIAKGIHDAGGTGVKRAISLTRDEYQVRWLNSYSLDYLKEQA